MWRKYRTIKRIQGSLWISFRILHSLDKEQHKMINKDLNKIFVLNKMRTSRYRRRWGE